MFNYEFISQDIINHDTVQVNYKVTDPTKTNRHGVTPVYHHSIMVQVENPEQYTQEELADEIETRWQADASSKVAGYEALWVVV